MIRLPGNIKICSKNDFYLMDQAFTDAMIQEHIRLFIFESISQIIEFPNKERPIRVASSMSMIKRLVTPDEQVFKTAMPFGNMAVEYVDDPEIGALIAPQMMAMKNKMIPQELTSETIQSRMKNRDIKNNIDVRMVFNTVNLNVAFVLYDVSRARCYDTKRKWDYLLEPGIFNKKWLWNQAIVPKEFILAYCEYYDKEYDLNWFIEFLNKNANPQVRFHLGVDPGTKHNEVFISYPVQLLCRATSTSNPEIEEEGDIAKHWMINRTFLFSVNLPVNIFFGRELDKADPTYVATYMEPLAHVNDNYETKEKGNTLYSKDDPIYINTIEEIPEYVHIADYNFSKDDYDTLKTEGYNEITFSIFGNILPEGLDEHDFFIYLNKMSMLNDNKIADPVKVLFKLNNQLVTYNLLSKEDGYSYNIDNIKEIIKSQTFAIYIYFNNKMYRDYLKVRHQNQVIPNKVINIKQM